MSREHGEPQEPWFIRMVDAYYAERGLPTATEMIARCCGDCGCLKAHHTPVCKNCGEGCDWRPSQSNRDGKAVTP